MSAEQQDISHVLNSTAEEDNPMKFHTDAHETFPLNSRGSPDTIRSANAIADTTPKNESNLKTEKSTGPPATATKVEEKQFFEIGEVDSQQAQANLNNVSMGQNQPPLTVLQLADKTDSSEVKIEVGQSNLINSSIDTDNQVRIQNHDPLRDLKRGHIMANAQGRSTSSNHMLSTTEGSNPSGKLNNSILINKPFLNKNLHQASGLEGNSQVNLNYQNVDFVQVPEAHQMFKGYSNRKNASILLEQQQSNIYASPQTQRSPAIESVLKNVAAKSTASRFRIGMMDLYEQSSIDQLNSYMESVVEETSKVMKGEDSRGQSRCADPEKIIKEIKYQVQGRHKMSQLSQEIQSQMSPGIRDSAMQLLAQGEIRQSPDLKDIFKHQESQYDNKVWKSLVKKKKLKEQIGKWNTGIERTKSIYGQSPASQRRNTMHSIMKTEQNASGIKQARPNLVDEVHLSQSTYQDGFNQSNLNQSGRSPKKHWSVSPFNTISDFGTGKILIKKNHVGGGAPPSIAKDGKTHTVIDKHSLTTRIYRNQKNNLWAQISARGRLTQEQIENQDLPELQHKMSELDYTLSIPKVSGEQKLVSTQPQSLIIEETEEQRAAVEQSINNTFGTNMRVKRRDPSYYIKNPARVYVETLGNKHYAINKLAKGTYMSKLDKGKHSPEAHLPIAPKFGETIGRNTMAQTQQNFNFKMQARSTVGDLTTDLHTQEELDLARDQDKTNFHMTMTNIQKGGSFMNDSSMTFDTQNKMQTTFPNQMHNQSMHNTNDNKNLTKIEDMLHQTVPFLPAGNLGNSKYGSSRGFSLPGVGFKKNSNMALGDSPKNKSPSQLRDGSPKPGVKALKDSDYSKYLMYHNKPAHNITVQKFEVGEQGRQRATDVLDYIIQVQKQAKQRVQDKSTEESEKVQIQHIKVLLEQKKKEDSNASQLKLERDKIHEIDSPPGTAALNDMDRQINEEVNKILSEDGINDVKGEDLNESGFAEQDIKVQKLIDSLTKNKLKIEIVDMEIDLSAKRRMVHTPPDGGQKVEDQQEHIESLAQNTWLRKFVIMHEKSYDEELQRCAIKKKLTKEVTNEYRNHLVEGSPLRQARRNLVIQQKMEKRHGGSMPPAQVIQPQRFNMTQIQQQNMNYYGGQSVATGESQYMDFEEASLGGMGSPLNVYPGQQQGIVEEALCRSPQKLKYYLDPLSDKFTKQAKKKYDLKNKDNRERTEKAKQYHKFMNTTDLGLRKAIKRIPQDVPSYKKLNEKALDLDGEDSAGDTMEQEGNGKRILWNC